MNMVFDLSSTVQLPTMSSIITIIRLNATPFNVTIIQVYASTLHYSDEETVGFYEQLQKGIEEVAKKDILIVQGDWNAKVGEDDTTICNGICGNSCNPITNDKGLRLLEFDSTHDLILANTFGKPSRKWTWHSPNREHHNQMDYIMIRKRFRSSVNCPAPPPKQEHFGQPILLEVLTMIW